MNETKIKIRKARTQRNRHLSLSVARTTKMPPDRRGKYPQGTREREFRAKANTNKDTNSFSLKHISLPPFSKKLNTNNSLLLLQGSSKGVSWKFFKLKPP